MIWHILGLAHPPFPLQNNQTSPFPMPPKKKLFLKAKKEIHNSNAPSPKHSSYPPTPPTTFKKNRGGGRKKIPKP